MSVFAEPSTDLSQDHAHQCLVYLDGAPHGLGGLMRLTMGTTVTARKIVVTHYGRHQHFERAHTTKSASGIEVPLYRWTYSTCIAE
ncbi:DUF5988 family protein [Streptomyces qinglanensis]|uniref:Uncharacterized protein n=1 Tax=Streptomyces qinglanensis TaxID=943816 RepID=A0A1H9QPX3_9ACTN|nr:DUF5988 family protein [Streptomyces qinglanensis]SER62467.1 hypothetical protein SAMN05421870_10338 [Streptomyces qinglanensis]